MNEIKERLRLRGIKRHRAASIAVAFILDRRRGASIEMWAARHSEAAATADPSGAPGLGTITDPRYGCRALRPLIWTRCLRIGFSHFARAAA